MFVELFILMYKTQNYRHKNFSIKLFLPWWKKIHLQWIFTYFIWGKLFYCSHKLDFFFLIPWNIFYFLKPSLFLKYSQWCCCRCSLARLADGEMSPATWYFYTPGMGVLWWMSGQLWGQFCRNHTQKPQGFHFQRELSRKKKPQHCSFTEIVLGELWCQSELGCSFSDLARKKGIAGTWKTGTVIRNSVIYSVCQLSQLYQRLRNILTNDKPVSSIV